VHDETVLACCRQDGASIEVTALEGFQGSHAHPVQFASVEARLRDMAKDLHLTRVEIESPQGIMLSQRLNIPGVTVSTVHPTAKSNAERWGALYQSLKAGTIRLPADAKLRRQLLTLTIVEGLTGWRVEDVPAIHNDRAVAIAGAVHLVTAGYGMQASSMPNIFYAYEGMDLVPSGDGYVAVDPAGPAIKQHAQTLEAVQACRRGRVGGFCPSCASYWEVADAPMLEFDREMTPQRLATNPPMPEGSGERNARIFAELDEATARFEQSNGPGAAYQRFSQQAARLRRELGL
jgi:hypothetical protein